METQPVISDTVAICIALSAGQKITDAYAAAGAGLVSVKQTDVSMKHRNTAGVSGAVAIFIALSAGQKIRFINPRVNPYAAAGAAIITTLY